MKKYETPSLKETLFEVKNVIAVSGGILSSDDESAVLDSQQTDWDDSWN